ncbi:MAG: 50S ribosome-binding GTPase [Candidatus Moeniiplasma glomeromycotorum]|nr:50S ribosome-binding GTPase [Candidatus Moeniiplasma glomeromycotorum]MCE8167266.1 50S ribosome-binding GTPase [Candidatus Moeniiplasma glomeromycotorum]MCE8168721.1 50S ribosome-binding GTPase [Candidatus Moeniiplasma glomeromycotorum]
MVNNINAQIWLDKKYPKEGICERKSDQVNKGKTREQIIELDLSKGNLGKHFWSGEGDKILVGSLKLESFTKLRKLIISAHQITELDVSECNNLVELDCWNNQIDILNVSNCSNLKIINCSSNHIKELDLSTCPKLEEADISNCPELTSEKIKSGLHYDVDNGKLVKDESQKVIKNAPPQIREAEVDDIRNVLIVGITGNGKSTLANVLVGTNEFKEKNSSTSVTKNFQSSDVFQWEGKSYRIIDNIGFGDTNNISKDDILFKIGDGIHEAKEGINQILFVFKDRFSEDQISAFNLFKDFIAETGITKFTTIVKTGFENFRNQQRREEDQQILLSQTKELKEIINSCNGIVYVDNPAIPTVKNDDNEETKEFKEKTIRVNKRSREKSRKIVFEHLVKNCSEIYKLKEWDSIYAMVENYNKKKEQIEQSSSVNKEEELKQAKTELVKKVDKSIEGSVGASLPMPGFPISFNISAKYETHTEIPPKNN